MSDRLCNYCLWKQAQRLARQGHYRVRLVPDPLKPGFRGGVRVQESHDKGKTWDDVGLWFAEVTKSCAC